MFTVDKRRDIKAPLHQGSAKDHHQEHRDNLKCQYNGSESTRDQSLAHAKLIALSGKKKNSMGSRPCSYAVANAVTRSFSDKFLEC